MADGPEVSEEVPDFVNLPTAFQYSPSLNCLISLSKGYGVEVLDVHSKKITTRVPLVSSGDGKNFLISYFFIITFFHRAVNMTSHLGGGPVI